MGFGRGKGFSPVAPTPVAGVQSNDCQLEHDVNQYCGHYHNARSYTFTPDHDYIATMLGLLLVRVDIITKGPLIVKLELPATNCWEAEVLWSQELYSTDLPPPGEFRWTRFLLPNIPLTKGQVYRITMHTLPPWYEWVDGAWEPLSPPHWINWRIKSENEIYPRGYAWCACNYMDKEHYWEGPFEVAHAFCVSELEAPPISPIDKEVEAVNDDCVTYGTTILLDWNVVYLDYATEDMHGYFRFLSLPLLNKITITKAYIDLYAWANYAGSSSLRILGIKQANTATFSTQANADARPVTDAYVDWTPGNWEGGEWYGRTNDPQDIKAIIQEIVNQAGWDPLNALAIKIINTTRGIVRAASSFEGGHPAKLYIEFEE